MKHNHDFSTVTIFWAGGAILLSIFLPITIRDYWGKESPVGEKAVAYSTFWLRFLRKMQGRTF